MFCNNAQVQTWKATAIQIRRSGLMSISDEVEDQLEEEWGDKGEDCFP